MTTQQTTVTLDLGRGVIAPVPANAFSYEKVPALDPAAEMILLDLLALPKSEADAPWPATLNSLYRDFGHRGRIVVGRRVEGAVTMFSPAEIRLATLRYGRVARVAGVEVTAP